MSILPTTYTAMAWLLCLIFCQLAAADLKLAGQLFQIKGEPIVSNAKLRWSLLASAESYRVQRSGGGHNQTVLEVVTGNSFDDYGLTLNTTYTYVVTALDGDSAAIEASNELGLTPYTPNLSRLTSFDNAPSFPDSINASLQVRDLDASAFAHGRRQDVEYRYDYEAFANGSFSHFREQTRTDGGEWTGERVVLTNHVMCASANYSCKLEGIQWKTHPSSGLIIMWAHFERYGDYGLAEVANLYTYPGDESLTWNGAYRPLNYQSRDLSFYNDGSAGYLISTTNGNADMNIFELASNWTEITSLLTTVNKGLYREAPSIIKPSSDGLYYMFTSRTSGWLPSQPQYITASSMAGPWGDPVNTGNTATFCSQSGGVSGIASGQYMMYSTRWSASWPTPGGPTRRLNLPLSISPGGNFATFHFYPQVMYSWTLGEKGHGIYGIQSGKILSDGRPSRVTAGLDTTNLTLVNDGTQDSPAEYWIPGKVPFWYEVDLGQAYNITQVDLSTRLRQGSETYYVYNVTGSTDGKTYNMLADQTNNTDSGFSVSFPGANGTSAEGFRYVRVEVSGLYNNNNGNSATWAVGLHEVTVYGNQG
ncbi:unnamed protein product [Clonostachys rosea]|uniref:F5/8 type C domain-containing protein n=1 Tax=Bionectria ochroleuca TaxID=29856 RepID=A0ABY6UU37_BIOOC|nr:unnamed protein product [Clonostachys rosea]